MTDLSNKICCVRDNGQFTHVARVLARYFGKVYYDCTWQCEFPTFERLAIGEGIDGVERINNYLNVIDKVDILVYPDLYFGPEQLFWQQQGKLVWGARMGEELEIYRVQFRKLLKRLGLPVNRYKHIVGTKALREYLAENDDQWVKSTLVRGNWETVHYETSELAEQHIAAKEFELGPMKTQVELISEDSLPAEVRDLGIDGDTIDGDFSPIVLQGVEKKGECYAGRIMPYEETNKGLRYVNEVLQDAFRRYGYRGFYSTEVVQAGENGDLPYYEDPCCRCSSPSSEAYMEAFDNWGERIWEGAQGRNVPLNPVCKVVLQIQLHSPIADTQAIPFYVPDEYRQWLKIRHEAVIDGIPHAIPQHTKTVTCASLVALGDTFGEAKEKLEEYADAVKSQSVMIDTGQIDGAIEELEKAEAL